MVIRIPSSDRIRRAVANTLPAWPSTASDVDASTFFSLIESYSGDPVTGYSRLSYAAVNSTSVTWPSAYVVLILVFMPSACRSYVRIWLRYGGPGRNVDLAALSCQVPNTRWSGGVSGWRCSWTRSAAETAT